MLELGYVQFGVVRHNIIGRGGEGNETNSRTLFQTRKKITFLDLGYFFGSKSFKTYFCWFWLLWLMLSTTISNIDISISILFARISISISNVARSTIKLVSRSICSRRFEYLAGKCYVASDWSKNTEWKKVLF
jgi:hypothetical protein